jgi:hypothetical protein
MTQLGNYILKGAIATVISVVAGEALLVAVDTIKVRKATIKKIKEDKTVDIEVVKQASSIKKVPTYIKVAAKKRVAEIKKNPGAEIMAIWGCATYLFGNWTGYWNGFKEGWNFGGKDTNKLLDFFRSKVPNEWNAMITKLKDMEASVDLSKWVHKDILYSSKWVAEAADLADIVDTVAKEV